MVFCQSPPFALCHPLLYDLLTCNAGFQNVPLILHPHHKRCMQSKGRAIRLRMHCKQRIACQMIQGSIILGIEHHTA